MKFKREIIAIVLIICMLFTISAISAADGATDVVSATNASVEAANENVAGENNLAIENNGEILGETDGGTYSELSEKISNPSGTTVDLWNNYTFDSTSSAISISTANLVIDGHGVTTIDAKGYSSIFNIIGTSQQPINGVTFKNIIFKNGNDTGYSGAIYASYADNLKIENCTFISNHGSVGALYVYYCNGVKISNSTFINNSGSKYGAIQFMYYQGSIDRCIFVNNTGTTASAIYWAVFWKDGNISNSIFINNTGTNDVYYNSNYASTYNNNLHADYNWWGQTTDNYESSTPKVTSNLAINNYYVFDLELTDDGATASLNKLYNKVSLSKNSNYALPSIKLNVSGTNITVPQSVELKNGEANIDFVKTDRYSLTVDYNGVSLSKIVVPTSFSALKDLINNAGEDTVTLIDDYKYDSSKDSGLQNGIEIDRSITIEGQGHIIDAEKLSNIFYFVDNDMNKNLILKNIIFTNATGNDGAAAYFKGNKIEVINCTFINNEANGQGDALYVVSNSNENKVLGTVFINNTGSNSVIYFDENVAANISNSIFIGNDDEKTIIGSSNVIADYNWWTNTAENYNVNMANVSGITVNRWLFLKIDADAGVTSTANISLNNVYSSDGNSTYDDYSLQSIKLNLGGSNSGASSKTVTLDEHGQATFTFTMFKTTATLTASYENIKTTKNLEYVIVCDGSFKELYDLIWFNQNGVLDLEHDFTFIEGVDTITGGIYTTKDMTINGNGVTIDAKGKAAIFWFDENNVIVNNITFKNAVSDYGAAIYHSANSLTANYCTFLFNYADNGGAVYNYGGTNHFLNCTFGNNSGGRSGAVYVNSGTTDLTNCTFGNNSATTAGAVYSYGATVSFINSTFENNSATNAGVSYNYYSYLTFDNCTFKNNTANQGAVSYAASYSDKFTNSLIINNKAKTGAVFYITGTNAEVNKCILINNSASTALIYSTNGNTVKNSILLNNTGTYILNANYPQQIVADYNWFGNNITDYNVRPNLPTSLPLNNWYYLDLDTSTKNLAKLSLKLTDGTQDIQYDPNLPNINLTIENENLTIQNNVILKSGKADVPYTFSQDNVSGYLKFKQTAAEVSAEVKMSDFDLLQKLINDNDDVVNLTRDYSYGISDTITEGILIDKRITINGNGYTIDAKGKSRIFYITGNQVTINNVTLKNGKIEGEGAAIYWNGEEGTLKSSIIVNNTAVSAVYWTAADGNINNCVILNNSAKNIASTQSNLKADSNWFGHNDSNYDDATILNVEGVTLNNWFYLNMTLSASSANINLNNLYIVSDGDVANNVANALPDVNLTLTGVNVTVQESFIMSNGNGSVPIGPDYKDLSLTASFESALCTESISLLGDFAILQQMIIDAGSNSVINLDRNYTYIFGADTGNLGIAISATNVTINGNGFTIDAKGQSRIFKVGNNAHNVTINNITLINGVINNDGAAIYWGNANNGVINNTIFKDNFASQNGGAVYWYNGKNRYILNSIFENNCASNKGGAIFLNSNYGDTATIYNSIFNNNHVSGSTSSAYGGAIYMDATIKLNIVKSNFTNNAANSTGNIAYGGVIYVAGGDLNITLSNFINSSVKGKTSSYGGVISWHVSNGVLLINNSNFFNAFANGGTQYGRGGVLDLSLGGTHNITNSIFSNNKAYTNAPSSGSAGGAVIYKVAGTTNIMNSTFMNNSINAYSSRNAQGGVMYLSGGTTNVDNSTFLNNIAKTSGGVIYGTGSSTVASFTNSIFLNNTYSLSNKYLEVIRRYSSGTFNFDNCWFGNVGNNYDGQGIESGNGITINNRLSLSSIHDEFMAVGENKEIKYIFQYTENGNIKIYDSSKLPKVNLTLSSVNGGLDKNSASMDETILFNADHFGAASITAKYNEVELTENLYAKDKATIIVDPIVVHVGESIGVNIIEKIPSDASLTFSSIAGDEYILVASNGYVEGLKAGNSIIYIKYNGNDDYALTTVEVPVTVIKNVPEIEISNTLPITVDADGTVTIDVNKDSEIKINFTSNDTSVATVDNESGVVTGLKEGKVNITVLVIEDEKYESRSFNVTVNVVKTQVNIIAGGIDTTYNEEISITPNIVTAYGAVSDGTVKYFIGTQAISNDLALGAEFKWTVNRAGKFNITAKYSGSDKYAASEKNITVNAAKADTTAKVEVTSDTYETASTITVTSIVTGEYTIDINGTEVKVTIPDGQTTGQNTHLFGAGSYYANITAVPDFDNYNFSTENATFTVTPKTNSATITIAQNNYLPGEVTVNVTGGVKGKYLITISNGQTVEVDVNSNGATGENSIAIAAGKNYEASLSLDNSNYTTTADKVYFNVLKSDNAITISSDGATYPGKVIIKVESSVEDTYVVSINGGAYTVNVKVESGSGTAEILLPAGKNYNPTTTWSNDDYVGVVSASPFDVEKGEVHVKMSIPSPVPYGTNVTGTVIADVPGTYYVSIPGKEAIPVVITGTQNTFNLGVLDVNPYTATVSIGESDNYTAQSNTTDFEVKAQVTPFSTDSDKDEYTYGESVTVSYADLPDGATGTVVFKYENGTPITSLAVGGPTEYVIPAILDVKQYTIIVNYISDNPNYDSRELNINFEVKQAENKISVIVTPSTYPDDVVIRLNATVAGKYTVDINGTDYEVTANDTVGKSVKLAAGDYYANIKYSAMNYYGTTTNDTFTVSKGEINAVVEVHDTTLPGETTIKISNAIKGKYHVVINETYSLDIEVGDDGAGEGFIDLPAGVNYWANATFEDEKNYTNRIQNDTFDVNKDINNITVIVDSVDYPNDVIVKVTADIEGKYTVTIGDDDYTVVANDPRGISISNLAAKDYAAKVTGYDSPYYIGNITNATFTVRKAFNVVAISVNDVTLPGDVLVKVTATVSGSYTININGTDVIVNVNDEREGSNTVHLKAGKNYNATTTFENENYTTKVIPAVFDVTKGINNVIVEVESVDYPNPATVKVIADIGGTYKVNISGTVYDIVANGSGKAITLAAGNYSANITGYDDENYDAVVTNAKFTINKISAGINADEFGNVSVNGNKKIKLNNVPKDAVVTYKCSDESIAVVDGKGNVTGIKSGSVIITVNVTGSENYSDDVVEVSVLVNRISAGITADESISIDAEESKVIDINRNGFDGKLTFESNDTSIATVDSTTGEVTGIKSGKALITVKANESEKYNDESITLTVIVKRISAAITVDELGSIDAKANKTVKVNKPDDYDGKITFISSNPSIATVDENGIITAIKAGQLNITVVGKDSQKYNDSKVNAALTVKMIPFDLTASDLTIIVEEEQAINVNKPDDFDGKITFTSNNTDVAFVDANGNVMGISNGTATITVKAINSDIYLDNATEITVSVNKIPSVIIAEPSVEIKVGGTYDIIAFVDHLGSNEFNYTSLDSTIATVDSEGKVVALKEGTVNITLSFAGNDEYLANETHITVSVSKNSLDMEVDEDSFEISAEESRIIEFIKFDIDDYDGNITYISSDESIATVSADGKITGIKAGNVTVTIKASNSSVYEDNETKVTVNVKKISAGIKVDKNIKVNATDSKAINVVIPDDFDGKITFESSNPSVASVDEKGVITAHKGGSATITVNVTGSEKYDDDAAEITLDVEKLESDITLDVADITAGSDVVGIITVPSDGIINITIKQGSKVIKTENVTANRYYKYESADLGVGTYVLSAKYYGNDQYESDEISKEFTVKPIDKFEFNAEVADTVIGQTANVTVTLPSGATGKIRIGTQEFDIPSAITLPVQNIAGRNNVTVIYVPDGNSPYASSEITAFYDVAKKQSEVKVIVSKDIKAGENATIEIDAYDGADVSVYVDGEKQTIAGNKVIIPATAGTHTVIVNVAESDEYVQMTANATFTVTKMTTTLTINGTNVKVGEKTVIDINITDSAIGTVIVNVNGTEYSVDLAKAKSIEVALDKAGKYDISARYLGDDIFEAADSNAITVEATEKAESNIKVEIPESINVGDKIVINITSDNDNITVLINDTLQNVIDGKVEYEVINAGNYPIVVIAGETKDYASEIYVNAFTADKNIASVEISLPEDIEIGKDIEVAVKAYNGAVIAVNVDGKAQSVINNVFTMKATAGLHTIIASVAETDKYFGATTNATFSVDKLTSTVAVNTTNAKVGEKSTVTVNVTAKATGIVIVTVGDTEYSISLDNATSIEVVMNKAGRFNVSAKYLGDDIFNASQSAVKTIEVAEKETPVVNVTIPEIKAGDAGNITLNIPNATGSVFVIVDGVAKELELDENGSLSYPLEDLKAGNHTVTVIYTGDENNEMAIESQSFSIDKKDSDVNVTVGDIKIGENSEIAVSIPNATGNVSLIIDGVETSVALDENGNVNFTVPSLAADSHSIVVVYPGDDTHAPAVISKQINATAHESELKDIVVSGDGTITAVIVDDAGTPIANANITYTINGKQLKTTANANGVIAINASANSVVDIKYDGSDVILPSNTTIELKDLAPVRLATSIIASEYTTYAVDFDAGERGHYFKVRLVDENGKALANKPVKIGFNGKVYNKTTNSSGWAQLQINLKQAGRYTFAIAFLGDSEFNSSFTVQNINVKLKKTSIKASSKSFKAGAKTKSYTVNLKTDVGSSIDGKAYLKAGKKVTLKLNGRTYTAKTDGSGKATFALSISKRGKFAAALSFAGDKMYASSSAKTKITIR